MNPHIVDGNAAAQCGPDGVRDSSAQLEHSGPVKKKNEQERRNGSQPALGTDKLHFTIRRVRDQRVSSKK